MSSSQSQLGQLCEAVRYLGDDTGALAAALHEHARQLAMASARATIHSTGGSGQAVGQQVAAAFDAASRACASAANLLMSSGKLARDYAAANCGGGTRTHAVGAAVVGLVAAEVMREDTRRSVIEGIRLEGLEAPQARMGAEGLTLFPAQVLAGIGTVRYAPELRQKPHQVAVTWGRPAVIELYGSTATHPQQDGLVGEQTLILNALIHEVAHVVYRQHLSEAERAQWEDICLRSYAAGELPVTAYGGTRPREEFAEAVVALFARPEVLREFAPQRQAFVEGVFSRMEAEEMTRYR